MTYLYIYLAIGLIFSFIAHMTEARDEFLDTLAGIVQFCGVAVIFPWILISSFFLYKKRKNKK